MKLTLADFAAGILAFSDAYTRMAASDATFYPERTREDWLREVAAYWQYCELEEEAKQKRLI